jgi:hypothetical protein
MQLIYSTEVALFFSIIPEHKDAFIPSWHELENAITVEIMPLYLQPFTNRHFRLSLLRNS